MHTSFLALLIYIILLPISTSFFTAPISTVLSYTRRKLVCSGQIDTLYNGTTTTYEDYIDLITDADYCLIAITNIVVNNLPKTITYRYAILYWNQYRNIAINKCNFSPTMDIGYGNCIPYYYENATSIQLCICSTNNCSATYSTCQASVNQAIFSPPPSLPVLQPTLSNTITCQDDGAIYYTTYNITAVWYQSCYYTITFGELDLVKCSLYTPNHTVICGGLYVPVQDGNQYFAMIEGDYEVFMLSTVYYGVLSNDSSSDVYQYQTSTSVASIVPSPDGQYNIVICLCTTNNCNVNLTTCTSGMNIPSYLLTYNGSTSTIYTGSTSSSTTVSSISNTSTTIIRSTSSTIVSSVSTTSTTIIRSTSSTSSSIITTLQSSTTNLVNVSSTSVRNNNTLSTTTRSSTLSIKSNRSLLVSILTIMFIAISSI